MTRDGDQRRTKDGYDLRSETGIPTEPVGSLPRPAKLQAAYAEYDAGRISKQDLEAQQEEAVKDSISRFEATGSPIISDGEQRWSSFATYPVTDTLAGTGLADHLAPGGQYFAIFSDGHYRQLPRLAGGPFHYKTFAADTLARSIEFASKPIKQAVIAPSMLALLYPLDEEIAGVLARAVRGGSRRRVREGHPRGIRRRAPRACRSTSPRVASRSARIPATRGRGAGCCLTSSISSTGSRPLLRGGTGQHRCPHLSRRRPRLRAQRRRALQRVCCSSLFRLNAGYFLIQTRASAIRTRCTRSSGNTAAMTPTAWRRSCYIGVINRRTRGWRARRRSATCSWRRRSSSRRSGWARPTTADSPPFSIDEKPNHGSPDFARDVAFEKIAQSVCRARRWRCRSSASTTSCDRIARKRPSRNRQGRRHRRHSPLGRRRRAGRSTAARRQEPPTASMCKSILRMQEIVAPTCDGAASSRGPRADARRSARD